MFNKLEEIVDIASLSKAERMKYDESIKIYRDNLAIMSFEREQGREQGRKEGWEQGREEGRKEEKLKIARKLKEMGMEAEDIAQATGLTVEEMNDER